MVRPMKVSDWLDVARIYEQGITEGNATFLSSVPSFDKWDKNHLIKFRFIATIENKVVGWIALSLVKNSCAYRGVAEISLYVDSDYRRKGIGKVLLNTIINDSESNGLWTLQSNVFKENVASIKLHESLGFRVVGFRERIGKMTDGDWRDVVLLERRSPVL